MSAYGSIRRFINLRCLEEGWSIDRYLARWFVCRKTFDDQICIARTKVVYAVEVNVRPSSVVVP
jgi:hypothetical protein